MKKIKKLMIAMSFFVTSVVLAQPGTTISIETALVGETNVPVTINYLATALGNPGGVVGFQAKFNYDATKVAVNATGLNACNAIYTCTDTGTAINMVAFTFPSSELPATTLDISFDMLAGAVLGDVIALDLIPGPTTVNVDGEEYVDFGANPLVVVGSSNGTITIVSGPQPDYSSAPVAGTTLALNGSIGTNPTASVDISNAGSAGAPDLTGMCALSGADAASFSITSAAAINVAQGAAAQTMTVDCDSAVATGATLNASLDCTHNGDGTTTASPASYPLTCDILAISPQYDSTPAGGTALPLGAILQGGANPTGSITINNDNGDATTTLTGTCTAPAPFSVTAGGAFSVLQGAAAVTVDFDCDASAAPGVYAEDLSCTHNGSNVASPVTYPMTCEVVAPVSTGNPAGGSTSNVNIITPPGGSTTNTVISFSETSNQGLDITDLNCTLATGTDFAVVTAMPATIPAGGSIGVDVSFTDPASAGPHSDVMTCTYTDSAGAQTVTVNLSGVALAVVVPALSTMGYVAMFFGLLLVGFFGFRRRA